MDKRQVLKRLILGIPVNVDDLRRAALRFCLFVQDVGGQIRYKGEIVQEIEQEKTKQCCTVSLTITPDDLKSDQIE